MKTSTGLLLIACALVGFAAVVQSPVGPNIFHGYDSNGTPTSIGLWDRPTISTLPDADTTLSPGINSQYQIISATLTANRTITLSTVGAVNGDQFTVVRKGLGLFTLNVGGLKLVPSATTATVTVMFDGSAWQLIGYQLL